ncbi:hypothetical protein [Fulvimarina sp. MAC8]|uniref:hypothetical protein n=1 Tax=Fulvimarina sp. MAC8 TaxID=3162874 RepID=UPI0032ECA45F
MTLYSVDATKIANAIGSGDRMLEAKMLADDAAVEENGLTERYSKPDLWKDAVSDLIAGKARPNESVNGFAIVLLLRAMTTEGDRHDLLFPFADLQVPANYFAARGDTSLANMFAALAGSDSFDAAHPLAVTEKLGPMGYHAYATAVSHEDIATLLAEWSAIAAAQEEVTAFADGEENEAAKAGEATIRRAAEKSVREFYVENPDYKMESETLEEAVDRSVDQELEDPYQWIDHIGNLAYESEGIRAFLEKAVRDERDIVFVYGNS